MPRAFATVLLLALAAPAQAQARPFSQSLAQCAALYEVMAEIVRTPYRVEKLDIAARTMHDAAVRQAREEGRPDGAGYVSDQRAAQAGAWRARGQVFAFSREFRDWAAYCFSFARARGIELDLKD